MIYFTHILWAKFGSKRQTKLKRLLLTGSVAVMDKTCPSSGEYLFCRLLIFGMEYSLWLTELHKRIYSSNCMYFFLYLCHVVFQFFFGYSILFIRSLSFCVVSLYSSVCFLEKLLSFFIDHFSWRCLRPS
jgi:hypothetical protein